MGILRRLFTRPPDFYIGGPDNPYIRRWWILPRNRFFNIYLHNMLRDDDDRALHDHPWWNISIVLKGGYFEWTPVTPSLYPMDAALIRLPRHPGSFIFRRAKHAHRLELLYQPVSDGNIHGMRKIPSWSLFITGPRLRDWGFWCPSPTGFRWVPWQKFTDPTDPGKTGKGCEA